MKEIIKVEKLSREELDDMEVFSWPIWEKEASVFPWTYSERESCFILEGKVTVTPEGGEPVKIETGDFVIFPSGMNCRWEIHKDIRKHYNFG